MAAPARRADAAPIAGLTTTSPAGTQIGDLVLVLTWQRATTTAPTHTVQSGNGFVQVFSHLHDDGSTDGRLSVAYKIATQTGAQSYQAYTSSAGTTDAWTGCRVVQAGTFAIGSLVAPTPVTSTGTGLPDPPAATLSATRDWLVWAIAAWHHSAAATITPTAPTNYANLTEVAGSTNGDLGVADRSLTAPASENPGTFGDNITPNGTVAATVAIGSPITQTSGALALAGDAKTTVSTPVRETFSGALVASGGGSVAVVGVREALGGALAVAGGGSVAVAGSVREVIGGAIAITAAGATTIVDSVVTPGATTHESGALALAGGGAVAVAGSVREAVAGALAVAGGGAFAVAGSARETFAAAQLGAAGAIAVAGSVREATGALALAGTGAFVVTVAPDYASPPYAACHGTGLEVVTHQATHRHRRKRARQR